MRGTGSLSLITKPLEGPTTDWPKIAWRLGAVVLAIGLLAMLGWILQIDLLRRLHPNLVAMKFNTGLCLALSGLAVMLSRHEGARDAKARAARALAVVISTLGALTLMEYFGSWNFGIDQALFKEPPGADPSWSFPGRMGPATAFNFLLFGLAILCLDAPTRHRTWLVHLTVACIGLSTFAIFLGYFYRVELAPHVALYASIALHTVLAFFLLCAAILLLRPGRGMVAAILADSASGMMARRMLPAALLTPALLGWIFASGRNLGWYGRGVGIALLAAAVTILFAFLVWWTAKSLGQVDGRRLSAERDLRRSERHLSDFFDNAALALHWLGPDGQILRVNNTELAMLGYTRGEFEGQYMLDFHADFGVIEDMLARLHRGEELVDHPAKLRCKDGSIKEVLVYANVYRENGRFIHARCFTRDVTELNRAEAARVHYAAIVNSSDDAIISKDLNGRVTSWNPAAARLLGYTAEEMIGQYINRLIPAERQHEETIILTRLRAGESIEHYETVRMTKDGRLLDVSLTISPVRDRTGSVIGASKILHDISARKKIEAELRQAKEAAEAASRAKDNFLAALSHELRTPLTPVLMLAGTMENSPDLPTQVREDFAMIRKNVELEARIIDDLLDLTRITRGKLTLRLERVDAHTVLHDVLRILRAEIENKQLRVELDLSAPAPLISGDAVRLQQVLWNILRNAVKFNDEGGAIIVRTWNDGPHLRIETTDTGLGITPEEMPRIFDAFAQGSEAAEPRFGGLGLGLSIALVLVRQQGGRLWAGGRGRSLRAPLPPPSPSSLSASKAPASGPRAAAAASAPPFTSSSRSLAKSPSPPPRPATPPTANCAPSASCSSKITSPPAKPSPASSNAKATPSTAPAAFHKP